jgi:hypothetical protein
MHRVVFNDYVDASLAALFAIIVLTMVVYGVLACRRALGNPRVTTMEIGAPGAALGVGND